MSTPGRGCHVRVASVNYFALLACCWMCRRLAIVYGKPNDTVVRIGALFGEEPTNSSSFVAFRLAIDYVNKRKDILPNVTLAYVTSQSNTPGMFGAIKTACSLAEQGPVTVIGPVTTADVKIVSPIFTRLQIPYVTSGATDPTLSLFSEQYPYLFKLSCPDDFQSQAVIAIIDYFGWRKIGIVASSDDYGRNGLVHLRNNAWKYDLTITSISYFLPMCNLTKTLRPSLEALKNKGTRIVVLNCQANHARDVLDVALSLGMLQEGWVWIVTDGVTSMDNLYNSCADVPLHLQGLVGVRPVQSSGALFPYFDEAWAKQMDIPPEKYYAANVFDAVLATSYAIDDYLRHGHVLTRPQVDEGFCSGGVDQPWNEGQLLAEYLSEVSGDGVARYINFTELRYPAVIKYEIVNLRRKGWRKVGDWTFVDKRGHLNMEDPVFFLGMTGNVPRDTSVDLRSVKLRVVTIIEEPFVMMNKQTKGTGSQMYEGFCIDLLNKLQETLGFEYELYLVPDGSFGSQDAVTGQWNGTVGELVNQRADLVVASMTITYERNQVVDFTKPFMDLGSIIYLAKESAHESIFAFLDPFSMTLWLVLGGALILCGLSVTLVNWLSPFGKRGSYSSGLPTTREKRKSDRNVFNLWNSLWHTFSLWSTQGADVAPNCLSGRLVYGAWYFTVMIISATYTANLAAFLTVQRLDEGIRSLQDLVNQKEITYGTVSGGATYQFFRVQVTEPYKTVYKFIEERSSNVPNSSYGMELVLNSYGKPKSEQYAFLYDSIPLDYAANQPPCLTTTAGRAFNQFGYGLALQKNSPYTEMFSLEILKLRQSGYLNNIYTKWVISGACHVETSSDSAQQATVKQMVGVFVLMAGILVLAVLAILLEYCVAAGNDRQKHGSLSFCGALARRCRSVRQDIRKNIATCLCFQSDHDSQQRDDVQEDTIQGYDIPSTMAHVNEGFVNDHHGYDDATKGVNNSSTSRL